MQLKHKLFKKWFLIQMAFLSLLVILIILLNFYASSMIEKQMMDLYDAKMNRVVSDVEKIIDMAYARGLDYAINPQLGNVDDRVLAGLVDEIKQSNASQDEIAEVIIFFDEDQIVTSAGIMDISIFKDVYGSSEDQSFANAISEGNQLVSVKCFRKKNSGQESLLLTIPSSDAMIAILFNPDFIESILSKSLDEDEVIEIRINDHTVIGTSKEAKDYHVDAYQSLKYDLRVDLLYPEKDYYKAHILFQRISLFFLGGLVIIGVSLSYYMTVVKYRPIQKVSLASHQLTDDIKEDDLNQLYDAIDQGILSKNTLSSHEDYIRENAWHMLIGGELAYEEATDYVKSLMKESCLDYTLVIMEPLINRDFKGKHSLLINSLQGIVYDHQENLQSLVIVENIIDHIRIEGTFISMSHSHNGLSGIRQAYQACIRRLDYKIMPEGLSDYLDGSDMTDEEALTLKAKIQSGQENESLEYLNFLLSSSKEPFHYKLKLYRITGIVLRTYEELKMNLEDLLERFKHAFKSESHLEIKLLLEEAIQRVTEEYKSKKTSSNSALNKSILDYIAKNLKDFNMSAEQVSDQFNLNAAYFRQFFRQQNGLGFWEYLNDERMIQVKRQLVHTKKSIKDISKTMGYVSISTFSRAFKKQTGMTAGQYRAIARMKEHMTN